MLWVASQPAPASSTTTTCAGGCSSGSPIFIVVFAVVIVLAGCGQIVEWRRGEIRVSRDGIERRWVVFTTRVGWQEIAAIDLPPAYRLLRPRPYPVVTLRNGRKLRLRELREPFRHPLMFSAPNHPSEALELVDAVRAHLRPPAP